MSRRDVSVHDRERWVFNRLAEPYRARPGYPPALVDRLASLAGGSGRRAAELGAGTGLLAIALARRGLSVHAVEPAQEMLDVLIRELGHAPPASEAVAEPHASPPAAAAEPASPVASPRIDVTAVHASAEATGLPAAAFDLVVLADALQWIDPERGAREVARLLAPGGVVAVVDPRPARTPFMDALGDRIAAANFKARPRPLPVGLFFSVAGARHISSEAFDDAVELDDARLEAVLRSLSYVGPAIGPEALDSLLRDARRIAAAHGGARWARTVTLTWAVARG